MNKPFTLLRLSVAKAELDWDTIYSESLPRVFNYVFYRVGDQALAEDLTSIAFERAWKRRSDYQPQRAAPLTWILGIVRHVIADHFRQSPREQSLEASVELTSVQTVEETVEQLATRERLSTLLRQLPSREQELIALKYGADLTNREIAALTKLSESNVGTVLHRTVQKLRESWKIHD